MQNEKLGDLIMTIYKNLKTKIERDLKVYDIGMGQMQILMFFFGHVDSEITQSDLVKHLGVDKGNVSRSTVKLVEKGYIERSNKNQKSYRLTEEGVNLKSEIIPIFIQINEVITGDVASSEMNQTLMTLTKISKKLEDII